MYNRYTKQVLHIIPTEVCGPAFASDWFVSLRVSFIVVAQPNRDQSRFSSYHRSHLMPVLC
jgi:hypothetical protein